MATKALRLAHHAERAVDLLPLVAQAARADLEPSLAPIAGDRGELDPVVVVVAGDRRPVLRLDCRVVRRLDEVEQVRADQHARHREPQPLDGGRRVNDEALAVGLEDDVGRVLGQQSIERGAFAQREFNSHAVQPPAQEWSNRTMLAATPFATQLPNRVTNGHSSKQPPYKLTPPELYELTYAYNQVEFAYTNRLPRLNLSRNVFN
jgi:hypothetical protein